MIFLKNKILSFSSFSFPQDRKSQLWLSCLEGDVGRAESRGDLQESQIRMWLPEASRMQKEEVEETGRS